MTRSRLQVRSGSFFQRPEALPRGRHSMSRDQIVHAQRERLLIAVTELLADLGYHDTGVREISAAAGVSRAAFYACFATKDECVYEAYDRFIGVLVHRVVAAVDDCRSWEATVEAAITAYLTTLAEDPVVATAYQVEFDSLGRPARLRRREALLGLASLLKAQRDRLWPGAERVPVEIYAAAVYAVRQQACDLLETAPASDPRPLANLLGPAVAAMLDPP